MSQEAYAPQLPQLEYIDDIIKYLFTRQTSTFIMGFGRRESGKTDFSLLIAELLWKLDILHTFASNIKIYESPFIIEHITNLPDLEAWARDTPGKKLFILDEAGKALRRRTPMSKLNIELLDNLQILRKHKLSLILLAPADKYIDAASLGSDILDGYFVKPYFKNPKVGLYHDLIEHFQKNLNDIPATSVRFDTWDVAPFKAVGSKAKPIFSDKDRDTLWSLTHGSTGKDLGLHTQTVTRLWKNYIRRKLEEEHHASPNHVGVIRNDEPSQSSP